MLKNAYASLADRTRIVVPLAFSDAANRARAWGVLQSMQRLLHCPQGRAYSFDEMLAISLTAGLANGRAKKLAVLPSESLVLATRLV